MFNIYLLKRIKTIAECGSFSKAADILYVTRSALVQQIKAVEEELGFKILERSPKGVRLTDAGEIIATDGERLLGDYLQMIQKCRSVAKANSESITFGIMPNLKSIAMLALCREYRREYPEAKITFKEFSPSDFFTAFTSREFDLCSEYMQCYHMPSDDIRFLALSPTKHCLEVAPDDELANLSTITFRDLRGRKLMLYRRGITKCDDELRDYLERHEPEIELIDIDSYDSSLTIRAELEQAVVISYAGYETSFGHFVAVPLEWDQPIELGIGYHRNCNAAVKNFLFEAIKLIDRDNI